MLFSKNEKKTKKTQGIEPPKTMKNVSKDAWLMNQKMIACYRAQTFGLAVESGKEALDLIARSKRIQGDFQSLLDGEYQTDFQFILRHFIFFDVSYEFRCFVYQNKLTGITQVCIY